MNSLHEQALKELQDFVNRTQPATETLVNRLLPAFREGPVDCVNFIATMIREQVKLGCPDFTANLCNSVIIHQLLTRVVELEKEITNKE